ncbi:MAG: PilC/PilY family type IV pilus protein [Gallionella sp.]|nr:PilC/PilY family type IV pilus protein [Gallionella sp.]
MNTFSLKKLPTAQIASALTILAIGGAVIKLALAVTAFTPQNQPTGYIAREVLTNNTLTSGNETVFRAQYNKEFWTGNLYAYPVNANGDVSETAERWGGGAAAQINGQNFSTGRFIGTMKDDGTKVPFLAASLSTAQTGTLSTSVNGTAYTATQIVDYLRGSHSLEGATTLRARKIKDGGATVSTVLGDIIHSKPVYLSDAVNPTIFVGANDGMLHAINAGNGTERWAYVPSMLIPKMKALAANPYTHDYYVDGQIALGTITVSSTNTRILVGGLGAGGKGLYALNIEGSGGLTADSNQAVANKVLWEIKPGAVNYATPQVYPATADATAYDNLGYTYGTPKIRTINYNGTPLKVVIVGNGYNNGGNYQAYLYIIEAETGKLVKAILADTAATTDGTASSPNGLFEALPLDTNIDTYTDRVFAGDLQGTMWKFDLSSPNPAAWSASVLHTTSPAQPITASPDAIAHPSGNGYIVNFATGSAFTGTHPADAGTGATGDLADTSIFSVYGIWDSAPASNLTLTHPILTEREYTSPNGIITRVRRVTSAPPNWAPNGDKGWQVALPIGGERVIGEGSFISSGRYYFSSYNPTISYLVPSTTTYVWGENWSMALDATTGGSTDVFMELSGDGVIDNIDRIGYIASDTEVTTGTSNVGDPILTPSVDGIPVGQWQSRGVQGQPTLVKLTSLFTTLFNTNPDVTVPSAAPTGSGVAGGHFDVDIYYGGTSTGSAATATITVGSTGNSLPSTLGGIEIDGVVIVPALTVTDIPNGSATSTNATTIKNKVSSLNGYTASKSGSTITITAPIGASYNGKTLTVIPGTSSGTPGSAGIRPTGLITFSGTKTDKNTKAEITKTLSSNSASIVVGSYKFTSVITIGKKKTPAEAAASVVSAIGTSGNVQAFIGGDSVTPICAAQTVEVVCLVDTNTYNNGTAVSAGTFTNASGVSLSTTATAGGTSPTPPTGWTDLAPALSTTSFSGGADGGTTGDACTDKCKYDQHEHQYDDLYDVTGVNMLDASQVLFNLSKAIPSTSQKFKVIMHNQYLNPAVKIHIGNPSYAHNIDFGYVSIKNFTTSATLDVATLPTYNRDSASTGNGLTTGPKYIGSLAFNMPVDALTAKNWWGNGDVRAGLIPTKPQCIWDAASVNDGNMYRPVEAPANDAGLGYPADGPGVAGWSGSTTPSTAQGVRHGGALTIQIIRDTTPNSALELNDHLLRPEYGWRVKSAYFQQYVLAEYNTYWHHPNAKCFDTSGWSKTPGADNGGSKMACGPTSKDKTPCVGTDPKLGDLSGTGGTVTSVDSTNPNKVITTYADGSKVVVETIHNPDGSVTTVTTRIPAGVNGIVSSIRNADGSVTTTITLTDGSSASGTASSGSSTTLGSGITSDNKTDANLDGSGSKGSLIDQSSIGYKRISWKELHRDD